jgi:geranylgeranyl diphosphate synthase type I
MNISESVEQHLHENAVQIDNFINDLLKQKKPEILYEAILHIFSSGGKRLRPYLVLKSCQIVGGDPSIAIPFAAALEMLHNFTLIHDDIMDNDDIRRGVATVHVKWGIPIAIASGDLLFAKAYDAILKASKGSIPCITTLECLNKITSATISLSEGQVLDLSFPNLMDVSEDDYIDMVSGKTASLFRSCAEVGGLIGGGSTQQIEKLGSFAWLAGIAFQIIDDVLGVTADEKHLGKPIGSDLREGKKTLILIHAMRNSAPKERAIIQKILGVDEASSRDIEKALNVLHSVGSIEYARKKAIFYSIKAKENLSIFPKSEAKENLVELVDYFMKRRF